MQTIESFRSRSRHLELCGSLYYTRDALCIAVERQLKRYNISHRQAAALSAIAGIGAEATSAEISRRLFRTPQTVSSIIKTLEKKGLVKKTGNLKRKNLIRITLTPEGEKTYRGTRKILPLHNIVNCLSKEEQQQLKPILDKLFSRALTELTKGHKLPLDMVLKEAMKKGSPSF